MDDLATLLPPALPATTPSPAVTPESVHRHLTTPGIELTSYPEQLAYNVALILENNGDPESEVPEYSHLKTIPLFNRAVEFYQTYVREHGISFKLKCRLMADDMLLDMRNLLKDFDTPASTKVDLFKHMTALAEYVPNKNSNNVNVGGGNEGFTVTINLGTHDTPAERDAVTVEGVTVDTTAPAPAPAPTREQSYKPF